MAGWGCIAECRKIGRRRWRVGSSVMDGWRWGFILQYKHGRASAKRLGKLRVAEVLLLPASVRIVLWLQPLLKKTQTHVTPEGSKSCM